MHLLFYLSWTTLRVYGDLSNFQFGPIFKTSQDLTHVKIDFRGILEKNFFLLLPVCHYSVPTNTKVN